VGSPEINAANMDAVIRFLPQLDKPAETFGKLEIEYLPDGTLIAPAWLDDAVIVEFERAAFANGFVLLGFDWSNWRLGRDLFRHPERIARATLGTICKLITLHIRADRFSCGHLAAMCRNGQVPAILLRLRDLRGTSIL
jgi:hypothetical protein